MLALNHLILIKAIIRNHVIIDTHINFDTLVQFFDKYDVFTRNEMKFFNSKYREDVDKVNKLIILLEAKDEQGVYNFVRALNEAHEHPDHSVILEHFHKTAFGEATV